MKADEPKEYQIPTNFMQTGYAFNGLIAIRNLVDGVVMGLAGVIPILLLPIGTAAKVSIGIVVGGYLAMLGLIGIKGIPVSTYLRDYFGWRKRRKPYLYNTHGGSYTVSSADLVINSTQIGDVIANTLDKAKSAMSGPQKEYVEGVTFVFAEDPEIAALKDAQDEAMERAKEAAEEAAAESGKSEKSQTVAPEQKTESPVPAAPGTINMSSILNAIPTEEGDADHGKA